MKIYFKFYSFIVLFFFLSIAGCSQPLKTLMAVNAEQQAQQKEVALAEKKFALLLKEARAGRLKQNKTTLEYVRSRYGEPVLTEEMPGGGGSTWLYRKPVAFINSPKVYMDFDKNDRLLHLRVEEKSVQ